MGTQKNGNVVAIITMLFLFAMISFVTNLAAPIGVIWKNQEAFEGSNFLGMLGNMMNFLAYLFMGIPAGKLLAKIGYKKTALVAIAIGFFGVLIQFLSGIVGVGGVLFGLPANFYVYLLGAFVAGFSVCMLNTVVNPMLNLLGGGGNRGNQLVQLGGTANSLAGTLTPMLVGALIGQVTNDTAISDVNLVLYIALGVFAAAFLALAFIPIADPEQAQASTAKPEHSPAYRTFLRKYDWRKSFQQDHVDLRGFLRYRIGGFVHVPASHHDFHAGVHRFVLCCGRCTVGCLVACVVRFVHFHHVGWHFQPRCRRFGQIYFSCFRHFHDDGRWWWHTAAVAELDCRCDHLHDQLLGSDCRTGLYSLLRIARKQERKQGYSC